MVEHRNHVGHILAAVFYTLNICVNRESYFVRVATYTLNFQDMMAYICHRGSGHKRLTIQVDGFRINDGSNRRVVNTFIGNVLQIRSNGKVVLIGIPICALDYEGIVANKINSRMVIHFLSVQSYGNHMIAVQLKARILFSVHKTGNFFGQDKGILLLVPILTHDAQIMQPDRVIIGPTFVSNVINKQIRMRDRNIDHVLGSKSIVEGLVTSGVFYDRIFGNGKAKGFLIAIRSLDFDGVIPKRNNAFSIVPFTVQIKRGVFNQTNRNFLAEHFVSVLFNTSRRNGKVIAQNVPVNTNHFEGMISNRTDWCSAHIDRSVQKCFTTIELRSHNSDVDSIIYNV